MENDNLRHGMFLFTEVKIASACAKILLKLEIDGQREGAVGGVVHEEVFHMVVGNLTF